MSKTTLNARWHRQHRMPENATLAQRLRWHRGHAANCGCRTMPASIAAELKKRGLAARRRSTTTR